MIRTPGTLEMQPVGAVVGMYENGKDEPVNVAFKTDGNQWALAGRKESWSTVSLFDTAYGERLVFKLLNWR